MTSIGRGTAVVALVVICTTIATACGGDSSPTSEPQPADSTPSTSETRTADFTLAQQSDVGLREAHATFTTRSDGKTSVIIDFTIERTEDASGDLYAVSERQGGCDAPGDVLFQIGDASNGITTFLLDESFDDVVEPLRGGSANIVIAKKGGDTVDWCGASESAS
jgi:hypothetical protein